MPLVYIALAWCAGILLAAGSTSIPSLAWVLAALSMLAALFASWRVVPLRIALALSCVAALGAARFTSAPATSAVASYNGLGGLTLEGVITSAPRPRNAGIQFTLSTETISRAGQTHPTAGLVLVDAPFGYQAHYGQRIRATGELFRPPRFDTFSYADYLARSGIFSQLPNALIEPVPAAPGGDVVNQALIAARAQAAAHIQQALPEPYAALLVGTLLGDESGIAPQIEDAYAATGAAHVVAISGYNMVVISGILLALLRRTRLSQPSQAFIVLVVIALYTLLVGASASVVRAALMSALLIVGERIIRRRTFVPASLSFAVLVMSVVNPYVLWDVGFQLSLFATLGIVLFARPLTQASQRFLEGFMPVPRARAAAGILEAGLFVSLAAQALTLPLTALYFERLSLVSLPVNLLIAPAQPFILIIGGAAALLSFVSTALAQPLFLATLLPMAWTTTIVRSAATLPFAEIAVHIDPDAVAFFFMIILGGAMLQAAQPDWMLRAAAYARQRPVFITTSLAGAVVLVLLAALGFSRPDGRLHLWLLDMGHQHAVLIQAPSGAQALIDGGRFPSRLLLALGDRLPFHDRTLDVVILTQPDEFDYAALPEVFRRYPPGIILTNGQDNPGRAYSTLRSAWGDAPTQALAAGNRVQLDEQTWFDVLHPLTTPRPSDRLNDQSLILRLTYGTTTIMIPGDASQRAQMAALSGGSALQSDVLILPQHGTVASLADDFLRATAPQIVMLQADPANRQGDPNEDTLAKLEGLTLYRTDEGGTIHLVSDGENIHVSYQG